MNTLAERIKFAKRELTALKTSHIRGLGDLIIFDGKVTISSSGHTSGFWSVIFTFQFNNEFAAYPLVKLLPVRDSSFTDSCQLVSFEYTNNGFGARAEFIWTYNSSLSNQDIYVFSTSQLVSSSYVWNKEL